jgi:hypothetical protein
MTASRVTAARLSLHARGTHGGRRQRRVPRQLRRGRILKEQRHHRGSQLYTSDTFEREWRIALEEKRQTALCRTIRGAMGRAGVTKVLRARCAHANQQRRHTPSPSIFLRRRRRRIKQASPAITRTSLTLTVLNKPSKTLKTEKKQ